MRLSGFAVAAFALCASVTRCMAQEPLPVIHLSSTESARAKQATQDLKAAQDRDSRATTAWRNFYQSFQAAHPELQNLRFATDFSIAFTLTQVAGQYPLSAEAVAVELSREDRQKAESLHREMEDAKHARDQAEKGWSDYWVQFVLDHAPPNSASTGMTVNLPGGKSAMIPFQWVNGIIFTSDFKVAVPRY